MFRNKVLFIIGCYFGTCCNCFLSHCYSYFCPILTEIGTDDCWTSLHKNYWTDFWFLLLLQRNTLPNWMWLLASLTFSVLCQWRSVKIRSFIGMVKPQFLNHFLLILKCMYAMCSFCNSLSKPLHDAYEHVPSIACLADVLFSCYS